MRARRLPGAIVFLLSLPIAAPHVEASWFHRTKPKECRLQISWDELTDGQQRLLADYVAAHEPTSAPEGFWASKNADPTWQSTFWAVTDALSHVDISDDARPECKEDPTALCLVQSVREVHGAIPGAPSQAQFHLDVNWASGTEMLLRSEGKFKSRSSIYHGGEEGVQQPLSGHTGIHALFGKPNADGTISGDVHVDYRKTSSVGAALHFVHLDTVLHWTGLAFLFKNIGLSQLAEPDSHFKPENADVCASGPERDGLGRLVSNPKIHRRMFTAKGSEARDPIMKYVVDEPGVAPWTNTSPEKLVPVSEPVAPGPTGDEPAETRAVTDVAS